MDRVMRTLKTKYAAFDGRARRKEYWYFFLFMLIVQSVAGIVDAILFGPEGPGLVQAAIGLCLLVPAIAVGARRLHDIDKSGWWMLIWLIPIVGWIILIVWYATLGTRGPNRFGEDPIAMEEGDGVAPAAAI